MPLKRRSQQSSAPAALQTTRRTRQQASRAEADTAEGANEGSQVPVGKLQPSKVPRRYAPHTRTRGQSVEMPATDDLSTVAESAPSKGQGFAAEWEHEVDVSESREEHSDTDAWQSASAQDIIDMVLPEISRCNARLYEHIHSLDGAPATKAWWARLKFLESLSSSARRSLAPSENYFIELEILDQRLPGIEQNSEAFDAATTTLCSANLVSLLKLIIQIKDRRIDLQAVIGQIRDGFPDIFDAHLNQGSADDVEVVYDLAFRLHCCFLIEGIRLGLGNPLVMAAKVFCSEDAPGSAKQAKAMILAGPYNDFTGVDVNGQGEVAEMHSERMKALCSHLSRHKNWTETLRELEGAYPPEKLIRDLYAWASTAFESFSKPPTNKRGKAPARISSNNSVDTGENQNLASRPSSNAARPPHVAIERSSDAEKQPAGWTRGSPDFVQENESDSDTEQDCEPVIRTKAPVKSYLNGSATIEASAPNWPWTIPPSNQHVHGKILALDPKMIARISMADSPADSQERVSGSNSQLRSQKRLLAANDGMSEDEEDEEDDADEYETNDKPVDERRRMAAENRATRQPPTKRARTVETVPVRGIRRSASVSIPPRFEESTEESRKGKDREVLEGNDVVVLSQLAKAVTRQARERDAKPAQRRVFWNEEDTSKLILAISKYNCAWSTMESHCKLSTSRSQQAIRDKARNIKTDLLKADRPLFAGFDGIALSKKEKLAIINVGRNPERREDDLDEDGAVINNIWMPQDGEL